MQIARLLFATLESITREQDVITSLMTYYNYFSCSSVSLDDGRNIPKQSRIKKSSVDRKQVFDLFLEGAHNMAPFVYSRKCT